MILHLRPAEDARGSDLPPPGTLHLTCVVDNHARPGYRSEHGQAILVEDSRHRILFDTGQTPGVLMHNLARIRVDPVSIHRVVLSHGHTDHAGGLESLVLANPALTVTAHPMVFGERFNDRRHRAVNIGIATDFMDRWLSHGAFQPVTTATELLPGVITSGPVPLKTRPGSTGFSRRTAGAESSRIPDLFTDEQFLLVNLPGTRDWVMINGCCHRGVRASLNHAQTLTGEPVSMLTGGLHLSNLKKNRVNSIWAGVREAGVRHVAVNHCTGRRAARQAMDYGFLTAAYFEAGLTAVISAF